MTWSAAPQQPKLITNSKIRGHTTYVNNLLLIVYGPNYTSKECVWNLPTPVQLSAPTQ